MVNKRQILEDLLTNECKYGISKRKCRLWKPRRLKIETIRSLCSVLIESEVDKYLMIHLECEQEQKHG